MLNVGQDVTDMAKNIKKSDDVRSIVKDRHASPKRLYKVPEKHIFYFFRYIFDFVN